jgi:flagellar hook assembly protein FlgD
MDPDQMVNELTSISSLQQLVQIRTDMDSLAGVSSGQSSTGTSSRDAAAAATAAASTAANTTPTTASSVLTVGPKLYSQLNSLHALNSSSQSY